jgi:hypothetical protein
MNATSSANTLDSIQRVTTRVRILMDGAMLEGDHTHPAGVRLSDSLRNAASGERYMLLTDVTVRQLDGSAAHGDLATAPFVLVNTAHAQAIIPMEQA